MALLPAAAQSVPGPCAKPPRQLRAPPSRPPAQTWTWLSDSDSRSAWLLALEDSKPGPCASVRSRAACWSRSCAPQVSASLRNSQRERSLSSLFSAVDAASAVLSRPMDSSASALRKPRRQCRALRRRPCSQATWQGRATAVNHREPSRSRKRRQAPRTRPLRPKEPRAQGAGGQPEQEEPTSWYFLELQNDCWQRCLSPSLRCKGFPATDPRPYMGIAICNDMRHSKLRAELPELGCFFEAPLSLQRLLSLLRSLGFLSDLASHASAIVGHSRKEICGECTDGPPNRLGRARLLRLRAHGGHGAT